MTCIIGLTTQDKVYIAVDSAGVNTESFHLTNIKYPKVFSNGEFIIGYTSSFRMGQLLEFTLKPPSQKKDQSDYEYLCTDFIDSVRQCLGKGGFKTVDKELESGGEFLVGYRGGIYHIFDNFQVLAPSNYVTACGCGADLGEGAVIALLRYLPPEKALTEALTIVEQTNAGVRKPFIVKVLAKAVEMIEGGK